MSASKEDKQTARESSVVLERLVGPIAWLHIMDNTEGIKGNEPMKELTFSQNNPFGIPGINYSSEFQIVSKPLYLKA